MLLDIVTIAILGVIVLAWFKRDKIRTFFKNSETLFLAFMQAITGAISGVLAYVDFGPLVSLANDAGLSGRQLAILSGILFAQGLVMWIARKARDPEMK